MQKRTITAHPSQVMVEQLAASGVKYVFNNSGSREALFLRHAPLASGHTRHSGTCTKGR